MFEYLTGIYNITPTPFKADGTLIHKIGGWKNAEDFVAELKKALEAK